MSVESGRTSSLEAQSEDQIDSALPPRSIEAAAVSTTTTAVTVSSSSSNSAIITPNTEAANAVASLPLANNSYDEVSIIGKGAYGTVYLGRDKTNEDRMVALKKIRITLTDEGVPVNALREIALLKQLEKFEHPNIVRLLDICHGRIERDRRLTLILVFEYVEQDLENFMKNYSLPSLEPATIKTIMHQVLCGVDFLHTNRIIHRDLKPQNLLIDRRNRVKIADFGLARIYDFHMKLTTMVVTLWYRAPEVLLSNSYATPVDLWSCGCIFAELFRKRPIFEGQTEGDQLQKIFDIIGKPTEDEWPREVSLSLDNFRGLIGRPFVDVVPDIGPEALDLLRKLLKFVPSDRLSALKSLNHPYFSGMPTPVIASDSVQSSPIASRNPRCSPVASRNQRSSPISLPNTRSNPNSAPNVRISPVFVRKSPISAYSCRTSPAGFLMADEKLGVSPKSPAKMEIGTPNTQVSKSFLVRDSNSNLHRTNRRSGSFNSDLNSSGASPLLTVTSRMGVSQLKRCSTTSVNELPFSPVTKRMTLSPGDEKMSDDLFNEKISRNVAVDDLFNEKVTVEKSPSTSKNLSLSKEEIETKGEFVDDLFNEKLIPTEKREFVDDLFNEKIIPNEQQEFVDDLFNEKIIPNERREFVDDLFNEKIIPAEQSTYRVASPVGEITSADARITSPVVQTTSSTFEKTSPIFQHRQSSSIHSHVYIDDLFNEKIPQRKPQERSPHVRITIEDSPSPMNTSFSERYSYKPLQSPPTSESDMPSTSSNIPSTFSNTSQNERVRCTSPNIFLERTSPSFSRKRTSSALNSDPQNLSPFSSSLLCDENVTMMTPQPSPSKIPRLTARSPIQSVYMMTPRPSPKRMSLRNSPISQNLSSMLSRSSSDSSLSHIFSLRASPNHFTHNPFNQKSFSPRKKSFSPLLQQFSSTVETCTPPLSQCPDINEIYPQFASMENFNSDRNLNSGVSFSCDAKIGSKTPPLSSQGSLEQPRTPENELLTTPEDPTTPSLPNTPIDNSSTPLHKLPCTPQNPSSPPSNPDNTPVRNSGTPPRVDNLYTATSISPTRASSTSSGISSTFTNFNSTSQDSSMNTSSNIINISHNSSNMSNISYSSNESLQTIVSDDFDSRYDDGYNSVIGSENIENNPNAGNNGSVMCSNSNSLSSLNSEQNSNKILEREGPSIHTRDSPNTIL